MFDLNKKSFNKEEIKSGNKMHYPNISAEIIYEKFKKEYKVWNFLPRNVLSDLEKKDEISNKIIRFIFFRIIIPVIIIYLFIDSVTLLGNKYLIDLRGRIFEFCLEFYILIFVNSNYQYFLKLQKSKVNVVIDSVLHTEGAEVTEHSMCVLLDSSHNIDNEFVLSIKAVINSQAFKASMTLFIFLLGYFVDGFKEYVVNILIELYKEGADSEIIVLDLIIKIINDLFLVYVILFSVNKLMSIKSDLYRAVLKEKKLTLALKINKEI